MKKYFILSMAVLFLFAFAACSEEKIDETTTSTEATENVSIYDDGFGNLEDGEEITSADKTENKTSTKSEEPTKNTITTNTKSSQTTVVYTSSPKTTKPATNTTTSKPAATQSQDTTSTSNSNSDGLVVGEFDGGDSEDFGELF